MQCRCVPVNSDVRRHTLLTARCQRCGHERVESARRCGNCKTEFWCDWDPSWYRGRLTTVATGKDPSGRRFGRVFAWVTGALLLYGLILQGYYADQIGKNHPWPLGLSFGAFSVYEVWAYFNGRRTSIDGYTHDPTPQNTVARTVGLIADLCLCAFALWILYDVGDA